MISRELKATYYFLLRIPMRINGMLYRTFRAPRAGTVKVHLGPGQRNYLDGWINVDANFVTARCDVWANLIDPLPFRDNTVDVFYSHHVIEHLPDRLLVTHFREMYRCLKPGGMFRVGGPNGDAAIRKFLEGDSSWFSNFPDPHSSMGGKLVNFLFCRNEHLTILTESYMSEIAAAAAFIDTKTCMPSKTTTNPKLIDDKVLGLEAERTPDAPHTLLMEGYKPGARS